MNRDIIFPVTYDLKVIYNGDPQKGLDTISKLLTDLCVKLNHNRIKEGKRGSLVRLGFNITVLDKSQMDAIYSNLGLIPEIKWAT